MVQEFYQSDFPLVRLNGILHRAVDVLAQWKRCVSGSTITSRVEIELLQCRMMELDAELACWELTVPAWYTYGVYTTEQRQIGQPRWIRSLLDHPGSPPIMHYYNSLLNVYGWNLYRLLRISLNNSIINSVSTFPLHTCSVALDLNSSLLVVNKLAGDICSSVLSILTISIPGKPEAASEQDICGFRVQGLVPTLKLAHTCLRTLWGHSESQLRADWLDLVISFISQDVLRVGV
jgi:hypothetical protein